MKKMLLCAVVVLFVMVQLTMPCSASKNATTKLEFAVCLVGAMGLNVPAGSEDLSVSAYSEVLSNLLSANGVADFIEGSPNDAMQYGMMADVLYGAVGATGATTNAERINYLVDRGLIPSLAVGTLVPLSVVTTTLNNSSITVAIAEAYQAPNRGGTRGGNVGVTRDPASGSGGGGGSFGNTTRERSRERSGSTV